MINKTNEMEGVNDLCLVYYYYFSPTVQNDLIIVKEELDGNNMTIDRVNSTPYNGWIERRVDFFAQQSKYKVLSRTMEIKSFFFKHHTFRSTSIFEKCLD